MAGVSDLTRVKKQQQVIISLMKEVNEFKSFNEFLNFVSALEEALQLIRIFLSCKHQNFLVF